MAVPVPDVPLLKIFSFLDAFSLLQASRVNRVNALHKPPSVGGGALPSTPLPRVVTQTPFTAAPARWHLGDPSLGPTQPPSSLTSTLFRPLPSAPTDPVPGFQLPLLTRWSARSQESGGMRWVLGG